MNEYFVFVLFLIWFVVDILVLYRISENHTSLTDLGLFKGFLLIVFELPLLLVGLFFAGILVDYGNQQRVSLLADESLD